MATKKTTKKDSKKSSKVSPKKDSKKPSKKSSKVSPKKDSKKPSKKSSKVAAKKVKAETKIPSPNDAFRKALGVQIDAAERALKLTSAQISAGDRFSTGLLVPNLIMGGGLVPGMYSISGMEASAKSTLTFHQWKEAIIRDIPYVAEYDAEGSVDPDYVGNIFGKDLDLLSIIAGDDKRSRYYHDTSLEKFFNSTSRILRNMPDMHFNAEADTWMYSFPKRNDKAKAMMSAAGFKPSRALTTDNDFGVAIEYTGPQGMIFIDSYPALLPDNIDQDEAKGENQMAMMAGYFSKNLPKLAGKLKRKGVVLYGVNQLRENPGQRFGNPVYEPGGNALKFYSSVRNQLAARAVPSGWDKKKTNGAVNVEPSAYREGATDEYQFKHMKNTKNKFSTPFMSGWMRVWTKDHEGQGRGFDPVFDVFEYLSMTKQIKGARKKKFQINIGKLAGIQMDWYTFKCLVIGEEYADAKEALKYALKELGLKKRPNLRKECFKQIATGKSKDMMTATGKEEFYDGDDDADDMESDLD